MMGELLVLVKRPRCPAAPLRAATEDFGGVGGVRHEVKVVAPPW